MVDLQLDTNEEILLQAKGVLRYEEDDNQYLKNLYLSNKNLICVYEETKGFFSKTETIIDKISLRDVRVVEGIVQVEKVGDDDYGDTLQILYRNGKRELYELDEDEASDKEYKRWESAISKAVTTYLENSESVVPMPDELVNMNDLAGSQMLKSEEQSIPNVTVKEQEVIYCSSCGTKNSIGAKYCQNCGILMGTVLQSVNRPKQSVEAQIEKAYCDTNLEKEQYVSDTYSERKLEFAGRIYKCPNCGELLEAFVAKCPACGYELRETKSSVSIQSFAKSLETTKNEEQRVILVRSFPIPNNKEDIFEFLILAATNISGKSNREVFDAWIAKFEQCYQKAKLVFGDDNDFEKVQKIYDQTLKTIQKEEKIHKIKILSKFWNNPIFYIIFMLVMIFAIFRIFDGSFAGLDIIIDSLILWKTYKITTKKSDKE